MLPGCLPHSVNPAPRFIGAGSCFRHSCALLAAASEPVTAAGACRCRVGERLCARHGRALAGVTAWGGGQFGEGEGEGEGLSLLRLVAHTCALLLLKRLIVDGPLVGAAGAAGAEERRDVPPR